MLTAGKSTEVGFISCPDMEFLARGWGVGGGGGVSTPLYSHRYVPPHRVRFLRRFALESGMVFEGTTQCMNVFIVSIPNE